MKNLLKFTILLFIIIIYNHPSLSQEVQITEAPDWIKKNLGTYKDTVDTNLYDDLLIKLSKNDSNYVWPVQGPYPLKGAILPFNRIVAYYGNLYTPQMGVLGTRPSSLMLNQLKKTVKAWEVADPSTPVIPALHYVTIVASATPANDNLYIKRMPDKQIETVIDLAQQINALVFLDIQPGFSTLENEIPRLEKYLSLPNVHLGIDPEFFMKGSLPPGKAIGNITAKEINYAINYLSNIVKTKNLPPKILVIHRFRVAMLKSYQNINLTREVQFVLHMDGWGSPNQKRDTYFYAVYKEPVQFAGFKIFYKNDLKLAPNRLMGPKELLGLSPIPIYIQYQ